MKKIFLISCLLTMILFTACGKSQKENRKVEDYEELDDIISIKEQEKTQESKRRLWFPE